VGEKEIQVLLQLRWQVLYPVVPLASGWGRVPGQEQGTVLRPGKVVRAQCVQLQVEQYVAYTTQVFGAAEQDSQAVLLERKDRRRLRRTSLSALVTL
jgi:hypothetical protein